MKLLRNTQPRTAGQATAGEGILRPPAPQLGVKLLPIKDGPQDTSILIQY